MKDPLTIPGWYDWIVTYEQIVNSQPGGVLIEVGCYLGRSLCHLGQLVKDSGKPFKVIGVDHCQGSGVENGRDNHSTAVQEGDGTFAGTLLKNVLECGLQGIVTLVIAESHQATSLFEDNSLTMVFLDARHDYESVKEDITLWLPKVKVGGILGGDDMGVPGEANPVWPGVKKAVNELLPGWKYSPHDAWLFIKDK